MSEKIYLKVPSKPAAEFVSHGNYSATLDPQSVIAVENRRFADYLVREFACAEVANPKPAGKKKKAKAKSKQAQPAAEDTTTADASEDTPSHDEESDNTEGGTE